jgi:hypothetical protein
MVAVIFVRFFLRAKLLCVGLTPILYFLYDVQHAKIKLFTLKWHSAERQMKLRAKLHSGE